MSNANRLSGLIQPKGAAQRPVEIPQRGELSPPTSPEPAPAPIEAAQPAPAKEGRKQVKSLTVKLTMEKYRRLREHGVRTDLKHQQMIDEAITRYLDDEEAKLT